MPVSPDKKGYYGTFGGRFVPETLIPAVLELSAAYQKFSRDKKFQSEFKDLLRDYAGRPTPLYFASHLTEYLDGAKIYLKREDLTHTGSHKINNTLGQVLLAKKMGKHRIIAETGAGQHGVATATAAAMFGLPCVVYMGEEDIRRQALNVYRMKLLGAEVRPVSSGSRTLKDAANEALRDWVTNIRTTYYCLGSVIGPHPYPLMVRNFQRVIGDETRKQILAQAGRLPDYLVACVGGGSNSIGMFYPFIGDKKVKMIGVEAAGYGLTRGQGLAGGRALTGGHGPSAGRHCATLLKGEIGVLHGSKSFLLQTKDGQIAPTHSIAAGLDYPGVGPEHSYLKTTGRATYLSATDKEALAAFKLLSEVEGIIPALESSHAVAYVQKLAPKLSKNKIIVICLSGRGDKDMGAR